MSKYYKPVENKYQASRVQRLKTTIARLEREIKGFESKPSLKLEDYEYEKSYKRAVTIRENAIKQRRTRIREYTEQLQALEAR